MKKFLKSNGVQLLEIHSNDERVKDYPTIIQEISKLPNKGAIAKKKWLIVEPREFKKIIMKLNTKAEPDKRVLCRFRRIHKIIL